jgi:23S rRNA pseudouridine2605 synthase
MSRERLQKYLARCGVASRRASEGIILAGRVRVNGTVAAELGTTIDPTADRVEVDGVRLEAPRVQTYIALNKPPGVVSTASDPQGRPTVLDYVTDIETRLYPVGRLDYESEGLILLTDDGDIALRLTHPRHDVEKEYRAFVRGDVPDRLLWQLSRGIDLDGQRTAPARFMVEERREVGTWISVILHEGRNRQIRRMAAEVGLDIVRLIRVRIGSLQLGDLRSGHWRELSAAEVAALQRNGV